MSPAAVKSLLPFQLGFIRTFSEDPDIPNTFDNEVDLADAALRYFATPRFADAKTAISAIAGTAIATVMGWFVGNCITILVELDDVRFIVPRSRDINEDRIAPDRVTRRQIELRQSSVAPTSVARSESPQQSTLVKRERDFGAIGSTSIDAEQSLKGDEIPDDMENEAQPAQTGGSMESVRVTSDVIYISSSDDSSPVRVRKLPIGRPPKRVKTSSLGDNEDIYSSTNMVPLRPLLRRKTPKLPDPNLLQRKAIFARVLDREEDAMLTTVRSPNLATVSLTKPKSSIRRSTLSEYTKEQPRNRYIDMSKFDQQQLLAVISRGHQVPEQTRADIKLANKLKYLPMLHIPTLRRQSDKLTMRYAVNTFDYTRSIDWAEFARNGGKGLLTFNVEEKSVRAFNLVMYMGECGLSSLAVARLNKWFMTVTDDEQNGRSVITLREAEAFSRVCGFYPKVADFLTICRHIDPAMITSQCLGCDGTEYGVIDGCNNNKFAAHINQYHQPDPPVQKDNRYGMCHFTGCNMVWIYSWTKAIAEHITNCTPRAGFYAGRHDPGEPPAETKQEEQSSIIHSDDLQSESDD
ncbi:hypothetical protein AA0118_g6972 [Alternaria tenuissima]|nr:hypothetical protein AA0118_g6972 [Alternaria tenuissima]